MKTNFTLLACSLLSISLLTGCNTMAEQQGLKHTIVINSVTSTGIGNNIGTVTFTESSKGLLIQPNLSQLSAGQHGFHIHENPSCEPDLKDGQAVAALKAGGHLDPQRTGKHASATGHGHLGDLPALTVNADGTATMPVLAPRLNIDLIQGRTLMIHAGGDNYSDSPEPLGGGGARIACGVIQ
ncbi:MAG: superoxide dismutase [Acinetobacter sp.]|jgi:Cu-Zn family superoxide dismutase|nr:MAG: superoxide dismutase [Acinetobacter sp.]